jgi:putative endonuclease
MCAPWPSQFQAIVGTGERADSAAICRHHANSFQNLCCDAREFFCTTAGMPKRFVYVLTTGGAVPRYYVGLTSDAKARLQAHNDGLCPHTAKYRPWQLHVVVEFADERRASAFERYLKSGSGRAFARRHFESQ